MLKTFEELTKNEEWLKAIKNLKRRDTDKEFDEKCKKEYLENLKKSIDKQQKQCYNKEKLRKGGTKLCLKKR